MLVATLFLTPLLMMPWGYSVAARIKDAFLWGAMGLAGWFLLNLWSRGRGWNVVPARLCWPAAAWVLVVASSVLASPRITSMWGALGLLPFLALAMGTAVVTRNASVRRRLILTWASSAVIVAAYTLLQHYGFDFGWKWSTNVLQRAVGSIGNPIYLGVFLSLALPYVLACSVGRRSPRYLFLAPLALLPAVAATYSSAAWCASLVGTVVVLSYNWRLIRAPERRRSAMALVAGLSLAVLVVAGDARRPEARLADRMEGASDAESGSYGARKKLWIAATGLITEKPWSGWGPDGFRYAAQKVTKDGIALPSILLYPHQSPHSEWYAAATDGGLLGLLAWGTLLLLLAGVSSDRIRKERGPRRLIASANLASVVVFVIQGFVSPRFSTTSMGLALCWGLVASLEPVARRRRVVPVTGLRVAAPVWAVAGVVIMFALVAADTLAGSASRAISEDRLDLAYQRLRLATYCNPMDLDYARGWGNTALRLVDQSEGSVRVEAARQALSAFRLNILKEPDNATWHAGAALALARLDPDTATKEGVRAVQLAPLSANSWYSLSRVVRLQGDHFREKQLVRAAVMVDPRDPEPYLRLAEIFRAEGRADLSDTVMSRAAMIWPKREDLAPWRSRAQAKAGQ